MTLLAQQGEEPNQSPTNTPDSHAQLPPPKPRPAPVKPRSTPAEQPGGPHGADASLGELVAQLGEQMSRLARDELALAELEAKQRAKRAGLAGGAIGFGGGLAFFSACALVTAAILALSMVMRPWAAALAVGIAGIVLSGLFGTPGLWLLRRSSRNVGRESLDRVRADLAALREAVRR